MESSPSGVSSGEQRDQQTQQQKRARILLSCGPCRNSKLKCDREKPCTQCLKKGRADACVYAPKPEKKRPAKGMSARLKRLEGMVREMMDAEGNPKPEAQADAPTSEPPVSARVVRDGENAHTYVGATHCMAMLEDIEDLKSYFDHPEDSDDDDALSDDLDAQEVLLFLRGGPRNREELLSHLPERNIADRLITRYFASMNPSQHIIHRPTFTRAYARFWQDPSEASLHWIAQLFMMLGLGVFFNRHMNSSEVEGDSPIPPRDRIRQYKSCAGWALARGKYIQPSTDTLRAFLLYVESHFLLQRAGQMNCYVLSGVCLRLMLKMGLHRDPSKLAHITPFEGEMRRRMWNMAIQVELLVSFHMGLPSMMQGIETDTAIPRNLQDEDFDEDCTELPPGRPVTDWTSMTYPVHKTRIMRVFGQIARQAHALTPPAYSEIMRLDNLLQETWASLPPFMKVRPLDECVGDPPALLIQRFGLTALYNKCRCVLHRRYIVEPVLNREHDYSRQQCLEAALDLLNYQFVIWEACKPGHVLSQNGWFVSSLSVHDFLLAAMAIYLIVKNEDYPEFGEDSNNNWTAQKGSKLPTKAELKDLIKRSYYIWSDVALDVGEVRKTADTLATMLERLGSPVESTSAVPGAASSAQTIGTVDSGSTGAPSLDPSSLDTFNNGSELLSSLGIGGTPYPPGSGSASGSGQTPFTLNQQPEPVSAMSFPGMDTTLATDHLPPAIQFDPTWMETPAALDWRYLDVSLAHSHDAGRNEDTGRTWMARPNLEDMDMMATGDWHQGHMGIPPQQPHNGYMG